VRGLIGIAVVLAWVGAARADDASTRRMEEFERGIALAAVHGLAADLGR